MDLSLSTEVDSIISSLAMTLFELVMQNGKLDDDQYIMQQINDLYDDESVRSKIREYLYKQIHAHKRGEEYVESKENGGTKRESQVKSVSEACVSECYLTIVIRSALSVSDISKDVILAVVNRWESLNKDQMDDLFVKVVKMFKLEGDSVMPYSTVLKILASKIAEEATEMKKDKSLEFVKAYLANYKFNDVRAAESLYTKLVPHWTDTRKGFPRQELNSDPLRTSRVLPVSSSSFTPTLQSVAQQTQSVPPTRSTSSHLVVPPPSRLVVQPVARPVSSPSNPPPRSTLPPPSSSFLPHPQPHPALPHPPLQPRVSVTLVPTSQESKAKETRNSIPKETPNSTPQSESVHVPPPSRSNHSWSIPPCSPQSAPTRIHLPISQQSTEDKKQAATLAEQFSKDKISPDSEEGRMMMEEMFHDLYTRIKMVHLIKRWMTLMKDPLYDTYMEVARKQNNEDTGLLPEILKEIFPDKDNAEVMKIIQFLSYSLC